MNYVESERIVLAELRSILEKYTNTGSPEMNEALLETLKKTINDYFEKKPNTGRGSWKLRDRMIEFTEDVKRKGMTVSQLAYKYNISIPGIIYQRKKIFNQSEED